MEKEILIYLVQKHIAGTLTESEKTELAAHINRKQNKEVTSSILEDLLVQYKATQDVDEKRLMPLVKGILQADTIVDTDVERDDASLYKGYEKKSGSRAARWVAVAVIVLAAAAGLYFYYFQPSVLTNAGIGSQPMINDAPPGSNKAILTTADGSSISLDSMKNGFVTQQGNVKVFKENNGTLLYRGSSEMNESILFNTIMTPRGGQYQLQLSDGSRIKLNSFSSITYPVWFTGNERSVTITGEAFLQVAKNAKMPFKVKVNDLEVEVESTEFNINAYSDEPNIKTTLLEGTLQLSKNSTKQALQRMQQSTFDRKGSFSLEKNVNANEIIAWKNGLFGFNHADIKTVMRQLTRWYDVDVVYEPGAPMNKVVTGEIRRTVNLSEVLKLLEKNDIRCRIDGKTLIVKS